MKKICLALLLIGTLMQAPAPLAAPVYLDTPEGTARLAATATPQALAVLSHLTFQQNLAYCGPASIATVLNSLPLPRPASPTLGRYGYFTQDNIFTPASRMVKTAEAVQQRGMTLAQMAAFMKALGVSATAYPADTLDLPRLRTLLRASLSDPRRRVIANYQRQVLEQTGAGHQSPLAAYDPASDSVLVVDVAKFKYAPAWISLPELLAAMNTLDPDADRVRGLVVIDAPTAP